MNYNNLNTNRLLSLFRSKRTQLFKFIAGYTDESGKVIWKNDEDNFSMAKREHDERQKELNQIKKELDKRENV